MLSSIAGTERYQQHQTHANNLHELNKNKVIDNADHQERDLNDQFFNSGLEGSYKKVATHYRMEAINFHSVIQLRQDLFDEGLINIGETNTLTLATQTKSDDAIFSLSEALGQYASQERHFHIQKDLKHLQNVVANLQAAEP